MGQTPDRADELNRRIPPDARAGVACAWTRHGFKVSAPIPGGWRPRGLEQRFRDVFARPLIVDSVEG